MKIVLQFPHGMGILFKLNLNKKRMKTFIVLISLFLFSAISHSQTSYTESSDPRSDSLSLFEFPQIDILGKSDNLFSRLPGSVAKISADELTVAKPVSSSEVLRNVTGVNIADEDGMGLRLNLGMRGLDPDRSRNSLVLEDGVPVALAPYGEPELYYSPPIDRMNEIEIIKGSGMIQFGPHTIGGVLNYKTANPPASSMAEIDLRGGTGGYFSGILNYGTSFKSTGICSGFLYKRGDKIGTTGFEIGDFTSKAGFEISQSASVGLKIGIYDEKSNSTYVGLTQPMYDNGEYYTVIAPFDELRIRRYSGSITLDNNFGQDLSLKTTLYGYTTTRNWRRQDFARTSNTSNKTGLVFGDTAVNGGAIYMKNSTGNRDRQFQVIGLEPRIFYNYTFGNINNEFDGGLRIHYEKAFEQRINGTRYDAVSGTLTEDETRTGYAVSLFAENRFATASGFSIVPGLRYEHFNYEREIFRIKSIDTNINNTGEVNELIPGLGINFNAGRNLTFFAGVHKGFAPPRIKDAINNSGEDLQLEPERSWNYEIGTRWGTPAGFEFEVTGYLMDFSNQVIPVSQSSGGTGTGLVNGGATLHYGVEAGFSFNFGKYLLKNTGLTLGAGISLNHSEYSGDRFIPSGSDLINIKGNELPYSPNISFNSSLEYSGSEVLTLRIAGNYLGSQFADELNTVTPSANGLIGIIEPRFILDFTGSYFVEGLNTNLFITAKNLLDARYISSRRPEGIKAGNPRMISAGIELKIR